MAINLTATDEVTIIAEMANAHEGELATAKKIVSSVVGVADAIKFQVFQPNELALPSHPEYEEFAELTMSKDEWQELIGYSQSQEINVIADVFGAQSLGVMSDNNVDVFKIHNADISNLSLIEDVSTHASEVILSAGGSTWTELADALDRLEDIPTILMYGYQNYPTAVEDTNLRRMQAIGNKFNVPVGYASHAPGDSSVAVELPRLAAAAGASAVEVHTTLDRSKKGTDYFSSLEPNKFEEMARQTRTVERLLGEQTLSLPRAEREYRTNHKKWLVATEKIKQGTKLTVDNVGYKRLPDTSVDTLNIETVLGHTATETISSGHTITFNNIDTNVVATLACRSESTRLYGKPFQLVGGEPILTRLLDQLQTAKTIDDVVLAIADTPSRDTYIKYAESEGLDYAIGSETNVLQRLITAGQEADTDLAVRVTTENPFVYTKNLDNMILKHLKNNYDYSLTEKLPLGASIEVVSMQALKTANNRGSERHRSELCTLFVVENSDNFAINIETPPSDLKRPDIRLTVDNPEDLVVARKIWKGLSNETEQPALRKVIDFLDEQPDVMEINGEFPDGTSTEIQNIRPFMYGNKDGEM